MEPLKILVGQWENLFSWSAVKKEENRKEGALHEENIPQVARVVEICFFFF